MFTTKGLALEGSGPGLVRVVGSFTTLSNGTPTLIRPGKGNFTVTRKAQGVYVVAYQQAGLSVVASNAIIGEDANIVGGGSVAFDTTVPGTVTISKDFMTCDAGATHYAADTTNKSMLILVYAAASNPTSLTLTDVYGLGNTSSKANYRVSFEYIIATSTENQ